MKERLLFLFIFFVSTSVAQDTLPPVYELRSDTTVSKIPDAYWQMLVDSSGKLTINDVVKLPYANRFHFNNSRSTGVGYSNHKYYWQRLRVKNLTGRDQRIVFSNSPYVRNFSIYVIRNNNKHENYSNGWGVEQSKRDGFKTRTALSVAISEGEELLIYKKMRLDHTERFNELNIGLSFYDKYLQQAYIDESPYEGDVRNSFIAGLLVFGFFLNLFFYLIVKEKVYFYYSLLLLLEGVWYFTMGSTLFFKEHPNAGRYFQLIFTHCFFFFSVAQFVRHFLKTYKYYPRWDKVLFILIILAITSPWIMILIDPYISFEWKGVPEIINTVIFSASMTSLLITFFLPRKEESGYSMLSVIAAIPAFLVWSFVYGVSSFYGFLEIRYSAKRPAFVQWIQEHSFIIEMVAVGLFTILFTWILLQQFALLRKKLTQQALEREREKTELINQQKVELEKQVEQRTAELKESIVELKATQKQLIQSEKMASLGELTAGIAHEIQNPLNFVNNFSDVNSELIGELEQQINNGNFDEVKAIANDIKQNEEKINHHGKRADAIVKGMLQHSRKGSDKKEPTDINALADEYLRLSYHGLRAKDKSFNASMETSFDDSIGKIEVVPQDLGRVLLNLYNNAFYSVNEKKKQLNGTFEPTILVSTSKAGDKIQINVKDNGSGIPQQILDKIYQPFFTTKPTGQGTGLGLSMSFDIIKAHGGEITVKSTVGEGTAFSIQLPFNQ
ncbi:MAG TPA: ATP-binding protein [Segetibacter sp.]|jgi:signal transduction histidine kinase